MIPDTWQLRNILSNTTVIPSWCVTVFSHVTSQLSHQVFPAESRLVENIHTHTHTHLETEWVFKLYTRTRTVFIFIEFFLNNFTSLKFQCQHWSWRLNGIILLTCCHQWIFKHYQMIQRSLMLVKNPLKNIFFGFERLNIFGLTFFWFFRLIICKSWLQDFSAVSFYFLFHLAPNPRWGKRFEQREERQKCPTFSDTHMCNYSLARCIFFYYYSLSTITVHTNKGSETHLLSFNQTTQWVFQTSRCFWCFLRFGHNSYNL